MQCFGQEHFNPLITNIPHQIETNQLIYIANQLTSFYMMGRALVVNGLKKPLH